MQALAIDIALPEALIGYARCVVHLGLPRSNVHAALARMCQYCMLRPYDGSGHNLCGLLHYHLLQPAAAAASFERALALLRDEPCGAAQAATHALHVRACRLSLAHALCCCERFGDAAPHFEAVDPRAEQPAGPPPPPDPPFFLLALVLPGFATRRVARACCRAW